MESIRRTQCIFSVRDYENVDDGYDDSDYVMVIAMMRMIIVTMNMMTMAVMIGHYDDNEKANNTMPCDEPSAPATR